MTINNSGSHSCDICGSNILGYLCRCGEMRCSCEKEPCSTCAMQNDFNEQQQAHEAEQNEREDFENRMYEKYHN